MVVESGRVGGKVIQQHTRTKHTHTRTNPNNPFRTVKPTANHTLAMLLPDKTRANTARVALWQSEPLGHLGHVHGETSAIDLVVAFLLLQDASSGLGAATLLVSLAESLCQGSLLVPRLAVNHNPWHVLVVVRGLLPSFLLQGLALFAIDAGLEVIVIKSRQGRAHLGWKLGDALFAIFLNAVIEREPIAHFGVMRNGALLPIVANAFQLTVLACDLARQAVVLRITERHCRQVGDGSDFGVVDCFGQVRGDEVLASPSEGFRADKQVDQRSGGRHSGREDR